jgi:hypothetical protein
MAYDRDQVVQLTDSMNDWISKSENSQNEILAHNFRCERAREYAVHGFSRRMSYLRHGMERIFELLPLDANNPDRHTLNDTTLFFARVRSEHSRRPG